MPLAGRYLLPAAGALLLAALAAAVFLGLPEAAASAWGRLAVEIQAVQRDLHRQLAEAMNAVQAEGAAAAWTLISLSFLYGVFHAAGPGHGKVVISTYLLTQESELRRGLLLSFAASLCQGATAILAVAATAGLLSLSLRQTQGAANHLEMVSYALIALLGAALMATRARRLLRRQPAVHHDHDHHHGHDHHGQDHDSCGHDHGPDRAALEQPLSWRSFAGMVLSIGIRPCSGAILVLLVAYSLDLRWAGMAAVLAMSLGTALTVALLATLSVYARKTSLRLVEMLPGSRRGLARAIDLVALAGGAVILLLGLLLLQAAWSAPAHPLG